MQHLRFIIALGIAIVGCGGDPQESRYEEAYAMAQDMVRSKMKIPKSTRFPQFPEDGKVTRDSSYSTVVTMYRADSVDISLIGRVVMVEGHYESQNAFGAFMPGKFSATLQDSNGVLHPMIGADGTPVVELSK